MSGIPTRQQILDWIAENPAAGSKRDIARAFGVKGAARIELKRLLREMQDAGELEKRRKTYRDPDRLPPVAVLRVAEVDADGDLFAAPVEWSGSAPEPRVLVIAGDGDPALKPGDRILARTTQVDAADHSHTARLIRRIAASPARLLGIYRKGAEGGRLLPIDRGADREWKIAEADRNGAHDGELVEAERVGPAARMGLASARVVSRLGDPTAPRAVSLIAIHQHGIPDTFPEAALVEAEIAEPCGEEGREDLRDIPFVTIDPADARDHDDAISATLDTDPDNEGGHVVWVAIADVAAYVRPGSALDREARRRGNSTYFPDRVVPMLPERLSADLCSLHEGEDRPVIAVRMVLDRAGHKRSHRFARALVRSRASLTYQEVQAAHDGQPSARLTGLMDTVVEPLFAAHAAAARARSERAPLELDLPERRIELSEDGRVVSVDFRERLLAHRLVEDFMVLANVAAAEELEKRRQPLLFRVHEEPDRDKLDALRETAKSAGLTLARGQVLHTRQLNRLLEQAEGTDFDELINWSTLRAMTQAYYDPGNLGHFGLALRAYAHFTSPIRRYSDLIVHRALISAHGWGDDGLSEFDIEHLAETAAQISATERRSMLAERDTTDRYLASYLAERVGNEMSGRISGIARFGLFVRLDETGADGLVPVRSLGREYFRFDPREQSLTGDESGLTLTIGQRVTVRLAEAEPISGGLILELLAVAGEQRKPNAGGKPRRARGPKARRRGKSVVRRRR